MPDLVLKPRVETAPRTARPPLYRVLLLNDDFTPARLRGARAEARVPPGRGPGAGG